MVYIMYSEEKLRGLTKEQLMTLESELMDEIEDCISEKQWLLEQDMDDDDLDRYSDLCELIGQYDDLLKKVKGALKHGAK